MISRITIRSGPAKFMKLARKLIQSIQHQAVSRSCKTIRQSAFLPMPKCNLLEVDMRRRLCEKGFAPHASHLERQHQLRASLYSRGGLFGHARGEAQFPSA